MVTVQCIEINSIQSNGKNHCALDRCVEETASLHFLTSELITLDRYRRKHS